MEKSYYYSDDYINENSNPKRKPRLIITDLYSRIIENEKCDILIKRLDEIDSTFPDFRFHDYSTPLLLACHYYKKLDFIEYLINNKNANINYSRQEWPPEEHRGTLTITGYPSPFVNGFTPLMSIIISENVGKDKIVKCLVNAGANVNSKNVNGHTPLMFAVYHSNINIVSFLIENGACVNAINNYNYSPLTIAFEGDNEKIFKELIKADGDINFFLKKWNNVNSIIDLGVSSLNTKKHEMYYYARKYHEDRINFICNLFENGIADPLKDYMIRNINSH